MTRPIRLLVTGFGPFPGMPRNPSAELARRIAQSPRLRRVLGAPAQLLVLHTAYSAIPTQLEPALAEKPDAVLMIGVARKARRLRVETRARNRASVVYPDASGRTHRVALDPTGPTERRSNAALQVLATLRSQGCDARASRDAGRYLCNASYFRVLAENDRTAFLHIPPLPCDPARRARMLEEWTRAGLAAAFALARTRPRPATLCPSEDRSALREA